MRSEDHIQDRKAPLGGARLARPPSRPFCLQPGHEASVASGGRPEFARRTCRGEEAHASKYFAIAPMSWMPGLIFGAFLGIFGNLVGGEPLAVGCVIAGAVAFPALFVWGGLAALRESKRRGELYSRGRLLPGSVIDCHATEEYCHPGNSEAQPQPTGAYAVTLAYRFRTPTGPYLEGREGATHRELPRPLPEGGTPVVVLYLDDDRYEVL